MSITTDADSIATDAPRGAHPRLSDTAIAAAKERFIADSLPQVAQALGFANTATLWRARVGLTPIRLADARRIANLLELPIDEVFEDGATGG